MRVAHSVLTLAAIGAVGIASSSAQAPARAPLLTKLFASSQDVAALIDKAKRDRKPGQAAVLEPMLSVSPYRENLEYRAAVGPAAVHRHEDEFFYVIEGSGTFVTGGQLAHPVQTNPENLTGDSIAGGTAVTVKKGDFFVVPENTPHWFSRINGRIIDMSLHVPGSKVP
jgi:mannose-6-phosphate isomerase-like protein (cupin superfamily)